MSLFLLDFPSISKIHYTLEKEQGDGHGQVLRFYGVWDDGLDRRNLVILYFLADDTIQVESQI